MSTISAKNIDLSTDAESIHGTEEVLILLYIYQAHRLPEFELANDQSGNFDVKSEFKHFSLKLNLPYYEPDFETLVKTAKSEIGKSDRQVLQSSKDNWSGRQLTNFVIEKNKLDYSPPNGCLIVGLFGDQCLIVKLTPNGVFRFNADKIRKKIVFTPLWPSTKQDIKTRFWTKYRPKTFEKKKGKKLARVISRKAAKVEKSEKTYSKKAKHGSGELDDFINNDFLLPAPPVDGLKSRTFALALSPMVSENFLRPFSPQKTFDVEFAHELLLSPSHLRLIVRHINILRSTKSGMIAWRKRGLPSRKPSLECMPEVRTEDRKTGLKSNPDLVKLIQVDNWLLHGIQTTVDLLPTVFRAIVCTIPSCRWRAVSKHAAFVVMDSNSQKGFHWMLCDILFDERTVTVCDPLLDEERDYRACFRNLFVDTLV